MTPRDTASTLFDTPLQLCKHIRKKHFIQSFIKLGEHITNGIERVIASCCHPLGFLKKKQKKQKKQDNVERPLSLWGDGHSSPSRAKLFWCATWQYGCRNTADRNGPKGKNKISGWRPMNKDVYTTLAFTHGKHRYEQTPSKAATQLSTFIWQNINSHSKWHWRKLVMIWKKWIWDMLTTPFYTKSSPLVFSWHYFKYLI